MTLDTSVKSQALTPSPAIATGAVTEYVWDHRNRLVSVIDRASDGGVILQSVEYVYDSQNRWITKSIDADGEGPDEATSTYFVYDGNQIILQIDAEGQVTNRYLWGPAVDQILADEQVQFDGSSVILWTLTDHLNTVRDLAVQGAETGVTTIANHVVYDAFGRVTDQTNPTVTTLFGFTARPFDRDTRLQNNLNRWYDAETGTWISEDPKGFAAADANLYRYVGNFPGLFTDPSGLVPREPITNEDRFREAAIRNGVPQSVIEAIIKAANETPRPYGAVLRHSKCEDWVLAFNDNLRKELQAAGHPTVSLSRESGGAIAKDYIQLFEVPRGATGNKGFLAVQQDHTAYYIQFRDGAAFYIDSGTLSEANINNITSGKSPFCPAEDVPKDWRFKPISRPQLPRTWSWVEFEWWPHGG